MSEMTKVELPLKAICAYCESQPIERLSEFAPGYEHLIRPDADIGLQVDYLLGEPVTLLDMAQQEIDLGEIIGKCVSLSTTKGLRDGLFKVPFESGRLLYEKRT